MPRREPHDARFVPAPTDLRAWLEANHATAHELWMGPVRGRNSPDE